MSRLCSFTLNSLGTINFGVSTPTKASMPQKTRMVKMIAKSLMSFLTCKNNPVRWCFNQVKQKGTC